MSDSSPTINGALLRLKREERGWLVSDMATRACMSIKQIRQLEEGGASSFYSESVKLTSAKKVGAILGLTADEVFGVAVQASHPSNEPLAEASTEVISASLEGRHAANQDSAQVDAVSSLQVASGETQSSAAATAASASSSDAAEVFATTPQRAAETEAEKKGKTPLVAMLALFVAALAVAAWMRPETEPVAVEPPPPLQTIPAEGADAPASAASSELETPASAASATALPSAAAASASSASLSVAPAAPAASTPASKPQ